MEPEVQKLGKKILLKLSEATFSKQFVDIETFSHKVAEFVIKWYGLDGLKRLAKEIDKCKVYRSYVYEDCCGVFKYNITIEYNGDKIIFFVVEKKRDYEWVITDVVGSSVWTLIIKSNHT